MYSDLTAEIMIEIALVIVSYSCSSVPSLVDYDTCPRLSIGAQNLLQRRSISYSLLLPV